MHQAPESAKDPTKSSWLTPRVIVGALIAVLLLAFVLQNRDKSSFDFLVFSFEAPLWLILAVTVVLAMLVGFAFGRSQGKAKYKKK